MAKTDNYLEDLKKWLQDTSDTPPEEMSDFFTKRLGDYEEHMSVWHKSYQLFAKSLPTECQKLLDLGCGTGLELDHIWSLNSYPAVTGVDLCPAMLQKLHQKHPDKPLTTICQDYFTYDFGTEQWDAVISFESLHHFLPERKQALYSKIYRGLKKGSVFLLGDYIACCPEEEELLRSVYLEKRARFAIPDEQFIHFDIPLTLEHETSLMIHAGFSIKEINEVSDGATIILAEKKADPPCDCKRN